MCQSSILRMSYEVGTSGEPEAQRGEFLGELPTRCHLEVTEPECGPESLAPRPVFLWSLPCIAFPELLDPNVSAFQVVTLEFNPIDFSVQNILGVASGSFSKENKSKAKARWKTSHTIKGPCGRDKCPQGAWGSG